MVESNRLLYTPGEHPDHCVVIKYVPYVGDSKRAMDEYTSEIMMGGHNTIVIHNTCEDSLLASPLILDLIILTELCQRIQFRVEGQEEFEGLVELRCAYDLINTTKIDSIVNDTMLTVMQFSLGIGGFVLKFAVVVK